MSTNWKPGMKAVCVVDFFLKREGLTRWERIMKWATGNPPRASFCPRKGEICTVVEVTEHRLWGVMLVMKEYPGHSHSQGAFRPVLLDAALAEQVEAIEESVSAPAEVETVPA